MNKKSFLDEITLEVKNLPFLSPVEVEAFNYQILDRKDITYDTEPACRAVVVIRSMDKTKEFEFFKLAQEAFYFHNKDLRQVENYYGILDVLNLDQTVFKQRFNSAEFKALVKKDFQRASDLGVNSFPTILLQIEDQISVLSRGYTTAKSLDKILKDLDL